MDVVECTVLILDREEPLVVPVAPVLSDWTDVCDSVGKVDIGSVQSVFLDSDWSVIRDSDF